MNQENPQSKEIFSVSEYIDILNHQLEGMKVKITGEVSEAQKSSTGHVYFYLKDEEDESVIKCIIWKSKYQLYGVELKEGVKIVASGKPNIHKKYGFSFIAKTVEYAGEGKLKKEYEKLKLKLKKEGFFEKEKKKAIPLYPQKIGVITSLKGAVIADFCNNLGKFGFKIKAIDSRVEGQDAVSDLLSSIKTFKRKDIDVLVIIRGGGSWEAMLAFNNELLGGEIAEFPVPVIAGIGHDKDIPLASLVSDVAVSTPTAVPNILNRSWEKIPLILEKRERSIISNYEKTLKKAFDSLRKPISSIKEYYNSIFKEYRKTENKLKVSLSAFHNDLSNVKINLRNLIEKSFNGFQRSLTKNKERLSYMEKTVNSYNPERQLNLGYAIVKYKGKIIRKVEEVKKGDNIDLKVKDGIIFSKVKKTKNEKRKK